MTYESQKHQLKICSIYKHSDRAVDLVMQTDTQREIPDILRTEVVSPISVFCSCADRQLKTSADKCLSKEQERSSSTNQTTKKNYNKKGGMKNLELY